VVVVVEVVAAGAVVTAVAESLVADCDAPSSVPHADAATSPRTNRERRTLPMIVSSQRESTYIQVLTAS
jgi:hypothetical protein